LKALDYKRIGLKVGIEIHQQLNSEKKLFCGCRTELFKGEPETTFLRQLRPTQSELGQFDQAAFFEFQKGLRIVYEGNRDVTCLVEMDEEPPHDLNREALQAALIISLMLKAKPIEEVHVMRKAVIDGSNTTGFQRTCIVAIGGQIEIQNKVVPIQHVGLEEDAARKMGEDGNVLRFRIDRLCIPLVEIATAPVIYTPEEAIQVALRVGQILRATGLVKRGLGTIRQDLNISTRDGALVEIKGVQELELISLVVENEVQRQINLLKIKEELTKRKVRHSNIKNEFIDVTKAFADTGCKLIRDALGKDKRVLAVKLPGFEGLLKLELAPGLRFGTEMADRARFWGRVGGIFHTDELPAYGITAQEVADVKKIMKAKQGDAVLLVADTRKNASEALKATCRRAKLALKEVPQETRAARPDGSTRYMRPRPGAARMYPETDIHPILITGDLIENLQRQLPELPEERMHRLVRDDGLNEKLAKQVLDSELYGLYRTIIQDTGVSSTLVAVVLTETLKALKRDGVHVRNLSSAQLLRIFHHVSSGEIAKEGISDIIAWLSTHSKASVEEAVAALGLGMLSRKQLVQIVDKLIEENRDLLVQRRNKAFGILMGLAMKRVRGKAKAELLTEILKEKLGNILA
jgi:glutamyl-tRNA(Gln) amidotransferase subunit E